MSKTIDTDTMTAYETLRRIGFPATEARRLALEGQKARHAMQWRAEGRE